MVTKLLMLMIILQVVNHLNLKQIAGKTPAQPGNEEDVNRPAAPILKVESTIPLKYLNKFWRFLDLPPITCEIQLDLSWAKDCTLIEHHHNLPGVNFMITSTKLSVPVVTLSINEDIKPFRKYKVHKIYKNNYKNNFLEQI